MTSLLKRTLYLPVNEVKLRFTPSGRIQFLRALSYIHEDNPLAAGRFRKRAEQALRRLTRYPESGRLIPEFPDLPFGEVIVAPYRFFYRRAVRTIWVVACWHGAQLPIEPMHEKEIYQCAPADAKKLRRGARASGGLANQISKAKRSMLQDDTKRRHCGILD